MSENIPESIPTSTSNRSLRPTKKQRTLNPQAASVDALFANPDRPINLPASSAVSRTLAAPPEIVANVQGSSAGAGSGEFHVYKASRRREYERLRVMDEENEREEKDREFKAKQEQRKNEEEEKLRRNQEKRAKAKMRRGKDRSGSKCSEERLEIGISKGVLAKKKPGAAKITMPHQGHPDEADQTVENLPNEDGMATETGGIVFHEDD